MEYVGIVIIGLVIVGLVVYKARDKKSDKDFDNVPEPDVPSPVVPSPPPVIEEYDYEWKFGYVNRKYDSGCMSLLREHPECSESDLEIPTEKCGADTLGKKIHLDVCCYDNQIAVTPCWECVKKVKQ